MADLILPDPRMEMPELFEPGRKPTGPVEIDWDHWAGKICRYAFIPSNRRDIAKNDGVFTEGSIVSASVAEFDNSSKFQYSSPFDVLTEFTVIAKIRRDTQGFDGLFSDKNAANWGSTPGISLNGLTSSSSGYSFVIGPSTNALSVNNATAPLRGWHTVAATYTAGATDGMKLYVNSAQIGARTPTSGYTASSQNLRIGTYYAEGSSWSWDGAVEYLMVFGRDLSADIGLMREISRHPHQFLIPA